jgi:hypothetical protein
MSFFAAILFATSIVCYYSKYVHGAKVYHIAVSLEEDINTLIAGDSHPMTSLDPDIIKNSKNISLDSENYFFTYYKLKYFLSHNSKVKNVILGFDAQNISKKNSERFLSYVPVEKNSYRRYYALLDYPGKNKIKSFRKYFIIAFLKYDMGIPINFYKDRYVLKYLFKRHLNESDFEFVGKFYRSEESNVDINEIRTKITEYYYNDHMIYSGISDLNIEYLHKIMRLCEENNVRLLLYRSPVLPAFKDLIPKDALRDFEKVKLDLLQGYKHTEFIDLLDVKLENEYFGDGDHVNALGAKVVSEIVYLILLKQ